MITYESKRIYQLSNNEVVQEGCQTETDMNSISVHKY